MTGQDNSIRVGGSVGGNVVAGTGNVVGDLARPSQPAHPSGGLRPRLGFALDVVGFGNRPAHLRSDLEERLGALVSHLVTDVAADPGGPEGTVDDGGSGDGMAVFLPVGIDYSRALPDLLHSAVTRLARDNERYRDRMRLRMAIGTGLLGEVGPTGLTGDLIVLLNRLVDSEVLRAAVADHPGRDLLVLVSGALHDDVIRPGYLDASAFTRVQVEVKELTAPAWLWLG